MSLILDALNRSRQETDEVPTLGTRHDTDRSSDHRSYGWLLLALIVALAIIAGLVWDRWRATVTAEGRVSAPVERVQAPAVEKPNIVNERLPAVEPTAPAPVHSVVEPSAIPPAKPVAASEGRVDEAVVPATADTAAVSALYGERQPEVDLATTPSSKPKPTPKPAPAVSRQLAEAAPSTGQIEEQDMDIEALVRTAEEELENARLAEHPAPFVNSLSQRTKDLIPTIYYQQHNYSGRAGQSRVVLNGKELAERGSPASGVKVIEILPDSVVLDYRGTQFRLRALNSWVNL